MRDTTCADTQTSNEWPHRSFLCCGPDISRSHDPEFWGVWYENFFGEMDFQIIYAVSGFVDHLIDILKIYNLSKEQKQRHNAGMAHQILKPQQIQNFEYNIKKKHYLYKYV